jgi:RNA polymerase subunit RPABC4/transcription elongation factor Spt4
MRTIMTKIVSLKCPNCGALIEKDRMKCQYCGAELILLPNGSGLEFKVETACPKCGRTNEKSSWFCVNCNTILTEDIEMLRERQRKMRFLQNKIKNDLPDLITKTLDSDEIFYCEVNSGNGLQYFVVTNKRLTSYMKKFFSGADCTEVLLKDIVSISPLFLNSPCFFNVTTFNGDLKFETYPFIINPTGFQVFYKRVREALADYEMRKKNIVAVILGLNLG